MSRIKKLSDAELTELLKAGEEAAFTEIFNRYWKRLIAVAFNYTRDQNDAKEIVQSIFISLWDRREVLIIQTLDNYLAKAVKFAVLKSLQREKRRTEIKCSIQEQETIPVSDDVIEAKFLQEYINGIVDELPEKCRLVFKYSRNSGLSIPQISEEMNIAEKTVEAHLTKALKTIRLRLFKYGLFLYIILKFLA
ncbi:RNA polymerase sigma-70 factor [Pararcticibacter amylolyticus]|uniref:RNA polymerase subunit sigma-70 n=1 Tax=Pararcticibacter amylolyticus TaxID=2173175 RepID=A0A2U2PGM0_9SPHI|nr:RNA polymerase sigma-70 factor [Pararcticibacter amylolyticus]PWG80555.1 RNA polymerase subunit sigma-70 [Pararcticibacter amylolyticus]